MRRLGTGFIMVALALGVAAAAQAQAPRTTPLPVKTVAVEKDTPADQTDPLLTQVHLAIDLNQRRQVDPSRGATPWMIMHGFLALRQDYQLKLGPQQTRALDHITQTNPTHREDDWEQAEYWFEATQYGGRPHPYIKPYAFEGHVNQFLAIMSMANVPLTHEFKARDPQRPGSIKTITMADMVNHAKMHVNQHEEVSWTLWFLSNYIEPDAEWINKDGQKWSMEQLVTMQTNAPLYNQTKQLAPCGGTHGLFALACACNAYSHKHKQLRGAWIAARQKLDKHIEYARGGQNRDGSFSTEFFKAYGASQEMAVRFKSSGHMLEWLMMALPPERLQEQWVRAGTMSVANDLVSHSNRNLTTPDTGAMYHALHALVLYRNRIHPPTLAPVAPPMVAEVPPELQNPKPNGSSLTSPPGTLSPEMRTANSGIPAPIAPLPLPPGTKPLPLPNLGPTTPLPNTNADATPPSGRGSSRHDKSEGRIRLLNPPSGLTPNRRGRPYLRPITNSKATEDGKTEGSNPDTTPPSLLKPVEPGRLPLLVPTLPSLEKPDPKPLLPEPVPSEPTSDGAAVAKPPTAAEGGDAPVPLFNDSPGVTMPAPVALPGKAPAAPSQDEPTPVEVELPLSPPQDEPASNEPTPIAPSTIKPVSTATPVKPAIRKPGEPPPAVPTPKQPVAPAPLPLIPIPEEPSESTPTNPAEPTPAKSPSSSD